VNLSVLIHVVWLQDTLTLSAKVIFLMFVPVLLSTRDFGKHIVTE